MPGRVSFLVLGRVPVTRAIVHRHPDIPRGLSAPKAAVTFKLFSGAVSAFSSRLNTAEHINFSQTVIILHQSNKFLPTFFFLTSRGRGLLQNVKFRRRKPLFLDCRWPESQFFLYRM